ncbi:MAG: TfoX/Sxy family protein [Pseudomonadota bacterium]
MAWKKPSPELSVLLEKGVQPLDAILRPMFGMPAYFAKNGQMFASVHEDHMILRLPEDAQAELCEGWPGTAPFEPMGRRMKEYVILTENLCQDPAALVQWLKRSFAFAASLPAKEKKPRKKKA